jgi:surface antigen
VVALFAAMPSAALADAPSDPTAVPAAAEVLVVHAQAQAQTWWATHAHSVLAQLETGPVAGQCTAYAAARRPDIIERVDSWAFVNYVVLHRTGPLIVNWLAKDWARQAAWAGMKIGHRPRRDAVIVFQPGAYGAFSGGHVAVVDSVRRNGSFTISEMHAPVIGVRTTRRFGPGVARAMAKDRQVSFIYR